jgi:hypothetical protein
MNNLEMTQELDRLRDIGLVLEDEAGLTATMKCAREGRFIPLGALGEKVTPEEYFADEHDHLRDKTRNAYFSVENVELRKKLIKANREIWERVARSDNEDVVVAKREVSIATTKAQKQPWEKAALVAVAVVAVGYWTFGIVGAIGGAVGGFFLGQGVISNARIKANAELQQATDALEQVKKEKADGDLMPEFFSFSEVASGERQADLDRESAYFNVLHRNRE